MAFIKKRNGKYNVIYYYTDDDGNKKRKWEPYDTHKDALRRKAEVEVEQADNEFISPRNQTVAEFLDDFITMYGTQKWAPQTYDGYIALIDNYIVPNIGKLQLQSVTARTIDMLTLKLKKMESVSVKKSRRKLGATTIGRIHTFLKCAFGQAVRWEYISRNPYDFVTFKKEKSKERLIWTAEIVEKALIACKNAKLYVAMNLSFACSLREGEIGGLTWDNVHVTDAEIEADDAHIIIDKELQRCSKRSLDVLGTDDVFFIFPQQREDAKTLLVLKKPKTESSVRKVWLPRTLAYILRDWKAAQDKQRWFLGPEYMDFGLVTTQDNGWPYEGSAMRGDFERLREQAGLPEVVFHSLRHTSTTYKLKLNNGDLKATQGDTGHATTEMILRVYAHILDDDRKLNAQKFESRFYMKPDLDARVPRKAPPQQIFDLDALITQLQRSPQQAKRLCEVLFGQKGAAGAGRL